MKSSTDAERASAEVPTNAERAASENLVATNKERFELALGMLEAYYEAVEQRTFVFVGFFVLVCGWTITSKDAQQALRANRWLRPFGTVVMSVTFTTFTSNILWWLHRWHKIYKTASQLNYVEPEFYTRYELRGWAPFAYLAPVGILYIVTVVLIWCT